VSTQFYVQVIDDQVQPEILYISDIYHILDESTTIVPTTLTDDVLNFLGFYKAEVVLVRSPEQSDIPEQYLTRLDNVIKDYIKVNNTYIIKFQACFHEGYFNAEWSNIRQLRDQLLQKTDWVESTSLITEDDRKRIKSYRQYLRDVTDMYKYPCDVVWIEQPQINMKQGSLYSQEDLNDIDFEYLKNYNASNLDLNEWNKFLLHWSFTKFNKNLRLIENLLITYTGYTLREILGHEVIN